MGGRWTEPTENRKSTARAKLSDFLEQIRVFDKLRHSQTSRIAVAQFVFVVHLTYIPIRRLLYALNKRFNFSFVIFVSFYILILIISFEFIYHSFVLFFWIVDIPAVVVGKFGSVRESKKVL